MGEGEILTSEMLRSGLRLYPEPVTRDPTAQTRMERRGHSPSRVLLSPRKASCCRRPFLQTWNQFASSRGIFRIKKVEMTSYGS